MAKKNRLFFISALLLAGTAQFCDGSGSTNDPMMMTPKDPPPVIPGEHPPDSTCTTDTNFCISDMTDQKLKLGTTATITGSITASATYTGTAVLSLVRTDIDTVAGAATDLVTSITPTQAVLTPGAVVPFTVTIQATTRVGDINAKSFTVHAQDMATATKASDSKAGKVTIEPVLEISYFNSGKAGDLHVWKVDGNPIQLGAGAPALQVKVRQTTGTKISFINKDPNASHIVHCQGVIPHQNTAAPTPPDSSYDYAVKTTGMAQCYDHNTGPSNQFVGFNFQ